MLTFMNGNAHPPAGILAQLSPALEETLIALPYRAGLFVSFSDTTGGWEAQEREFQTLTRVLRDFLEDYCKNELSQHVLMETMNRRNLWPAWSQSIDSVPKEAQDILISLSPLLPEQTVNGFKDVLVDIALAVAMAFHEGDGQGPSSPRRAESLAARLMGRFTGAKQAAEPFLYLNISDPEKKALARLCAALDYTRFRR